MSNFNQSNFNQSTALLLNRPLSDNGLATGNKSIIGVGTLLAPIDYYIEALPGERLLIVRLMFHIVDSGKLNSGFYGNDITMTNGIQLFYKRGAFTFDITDGFPIKTNVDWGRWCYDSNVSSYGTGNEALNARRTLTNMEIQKV